MRRPHLLGQTPIASLRALFARGQRAPLLLTCYGKADCSLCDKAKGPVARIVRDSGGRVLAEWRDIGDEPNALARWGERIPVICLGDAVLAEGKVSELRLRRALEPYLRGAATGGGHRA